VLSPLLYILYTDDCRSKHDNRFIVKFADDTAIVSLLGAGECDHGPVVEDFVQWCNDAFLQINVLKTKDMLIDLRRNQTDLKRTTIKEQEVDVVEAYKYLGCVIDNKLNFNVNVEMICRRGQKRLYCLRRWSKFKVDRTFMILFYKSYIESVLTFSMLCCYGSLGVKAKTALVRIVNTSSKILGVQQSHPTDQYNRQVRKARSILMVTSHPLYSEFQFLPSGFRLRFPLVRSNRYKH